MALRRLTSATALEIAPGLSANEIDQIAHGHFHIDQMEAKPLRQIPLDVTARRTVRTTLYRHLEIRGERVGLALRLEQPHHTHQGRRNGTSANGPRIGGPEREGGSSCRVDIAVEGGLAAT